MLKGLDSSAGNELLDKVISQREIMQACKNLKNGKSCAFNFATSCVYYTNL
jgi:hypothetical protein